MAVFELNIYGENDEILKTYTTSHIRWGLLNKALEIEDQIKESDIREQMAVLSEFVKEIFVGITTEEVNNADSRDIISNFTQLTRMAGKMTGSKNA